MRIERRRFITLCCTLLAVVAFAPVSATGIRAPRIDYAERPVREFLKMHFAGSRSFSHGGLDKKERFLTRRFRLGLYKFFGRDAKSNTAPPLVVDPFTGSQGATTFSVGDAKVRSEKAWVPVRFSDGTNEWTITYVLRNDQERNDERWRIDDIQDRRGMLLSDVLKK